MADETNTTPPPTTTQPSGGDTQPEAKGLKALMQGDQRVGPLGIIITGALLILSTILLLIFFTRLWPVCNDLGSEADDTAAGAAAANRNTAPPAGNANANTNAARPAGNANAGNTNAGNANANANTNANLAADQPGDTNVNGGGGAEQPAAPGTGGESPTRPILRTIEPKQGPVTGKTLVTLTGRNFGTDPKALVIKFGGSEASVLNAQDESVSVSTTRHSEGVVDVSVARNGEGDTLKSAYTYQCPSPGGSILFWMIIMAGALGGLIHAMRSLFWYAGQRELMWSWLPMYFLLPFIGAAMALLFGMLIVAGFFNPTSTGSSQALVMIALAGLVGMFSQQAALKLKDVAEAVFTKPQEGTDSKPQQSLAPGADASAPTKPKTPVMDVSQGPLKGGTEVTITGEGFSDTTTVTFDGVQADVNPNKPAPTATSINVLTPEGKKLGLVDVVVTTGNQTAKLPTQFEYTSGQPSGVETGGEPGGEKLGGENLARELEGDENGGVEIVGGEVPEGENEGG